MGKTLGCPNEARLEEFKPEGKDKPHYSDSEMKLLKEIFKKMSQPLGIQ